jgi:glutathione S-transferase
MSTFMTLPAVQPLFLFASLLVVKMFAVGFTTALWRSKAKVVVNPEDVGVNPGSHVEGTDAPNVLRAKRAHLNDLENVPGFLVLALLFTLAGASKNAGWAYFGLYFGARTLHTLFYLAQAQPFRTIAFVIGQITMVGVAVQLIMKAFL